MRIPVSSLFVLLLAVPRPGARGESISRLGADVVPRAQELRLRVDARQAEYSGTTTIDLEVATPVTGFRLHAHDLTIESLELSRRGAPLAVTHAPNGEDEIEVVSTSPLPKGAGYRLRIAFRNDFDTQANALYKVERDGRAYLFTQFQDIHARDAFPCWDEPAFKIPWRVILEVPRDDVALSNTRVEREREADGWRTVTFRASPPMPSYLVALATGPLDTVEIPGMRMPARVVVPRGMASQARAAVESCPPILRSLERYFGSPYPYDKLDLVAVPEFWYGAMENAGAITFRDSILLLDPREATQDQVHDLRDTLAHELAHMWFGDLVTMEWWDDLWLNESFATWMATKVMDDVWPESLSGARQVGAVQFAMALDSLASARAIRQKVETQSVLLESADPLAYEKGQAVLVMTEAWLGEATFRRGVLRHLREHAWGNARGQDLWDALSRASRRDVGAVMTSFLDQPGIPVVSARALPGGRVALEQRRHLAAGQTRSAAQAWRVPLTLGFDAGHGRQARTLLLDGPQAEVSLTDAADIAWMHPNAGEMAYARWVLEPEALARLIAHRSELDLRERIGLPHAVQAQLASGLIGGDTALASFGALAEDAHPRVLAAWLSAVGDAWPLLASPEALPGLRAWLSRTLEPARARVGTAATPGEDPLVTQSRTRLIGMLGFLARDRDLLAQARVVATAELAGSGTTDADMRETWLGLAAVEGDAAFFDACVARYEALRAPAERAEVLQALAQFRDPALTRRALDFAVSDSVAPTEIGGVLFTMLREPERGALAYAWVKERHADLTARMPPFMRAFLPVIASGCDLAQVADARAFFLVPEREVAGMQRALAQAEDATRTCETVRVAERDRVADFLAGAPAR